MIATCTLILFGFQPVAMATGEQQAEHLQADNRNLHEHFKARLDKLAERLEIKASQQNAWDAFSKSLEALIEHKVKTIDENADAATIARYQADRANEFAGKLNVVADATSTLQKSLNEEQRKILNQVSRHFLHRRHEWHDNAKLKWHLDEHNQ
jgi:HD-GYP domain-containing protein (c-di-GMP phosphodiesterase class II)